METVDQVVEIAMAHSQLSQALKILESFCIDFVSHRVSCYSPFASSASQSLSDAPITTKYGFRMSSF